MEICFYTATRHTYRFFDTGLVIDSKLLLQHMYDFFSWREYQFVHIRNQALDVVVADLIIVGLGKDAARLNTFDVRPGFTYVDNFDVYIGLSFGTRYGLADTSHSLGDIG